MQTLHLVTDDMPYRKPYPWHEPVNQTPIKIYLAARYTRMRELQGYRDILQGSGFTMVARWVNGEHEAYENDPHLRGRFAQEDLEDVERADWVINFTEEPRAHATRGGRHVEFGMAVALKKRLIVIGWRENVFHYLPQVEFYRSWQEFFPG